MKAWLIVSNILSVPLYFSLRLIWNEYSNAHPRSNIWKPWWKQADTCKMFTLFQNFADLCLQNSLFCWFREFAPTFAKIAPFFAKMGTSVVYVLIGSVCVCVGGGGGHVMVMLIYYVVSYHIMRIFQLLIQYHTYISKPQQSFASPKLILRRDQTVAIEVNVFELVAELRMQLHTHTATFK